MQTDEDGNYLTTLPVGKEYALDVSRKGYLFFSENYNLDNNSDSIYTADIPLQPIEGRRVGNSEKHFFDNKKAELKPASIVELNEVVRLMNDNPKLKIRISGYTDNVGTPADNCYSPTTGHWQL